MSEFNVHVDINIIRSVYIMQSGYGVSGNFLSCYFSVTGKSNHYEALDIQRTRGAAADAASRKLRREASIHETGFVGIQVGHNALRFSEY
jgi:hypothetical protein